MKQSRDMREEIYPQASPASNVSQNPILRPTCCKAVNLQGSRPRFETEANVQLIITVNTRFYFEDILQS